MEIPKNCGACQYIQGKDYEGVVFWQCMHPRSYDKNGVPMFVARAEEPTELCGLKQPKISLWQRLFGKKPKPETATPAPPAPLADPAPQKEHYDTSGYSMALPKEHYDTPLCGHGFLDVERLMSFQHQAPQTTENWQGKAEKLAAGFSHLKSPISQKAK